MEGSPELLGSATHGPSTGWVSGSAGMPHLGSQHSQSFRRSSTNPCIISSWAFWLHSLRILIPWGAVFWDDFPAVPVSLLSRWSQGTQGKVRKSLLCWGHGRVLPAPSPVLIVPHIWETPSGLEVGYSPGQLLGASLGPRDGQAGGAAFGVSSSQQLFYCGLAETGLAVPFPPAFCLNQLSSLQQLPLCGSSPMQAEGTEVSFPLPGDQVGQGHPDPQPRAQACLRSHPERRALYNREQFADAASWTKEEGGPCGTPHG